MRREVVAALGNSVQKEIKKLCSDSHDSILRMKSKTALERFTWERVWLEIQMNAPLLVSLFLHHLKEKTKLSGQLFAHALVFLLKLRCQKVNIVQAVIGVVLKAGHATKQVIATCNFGTYL